MPEKETILVIDDEQGIRDMLFLFLTREGYTVICAVDGCEGVEKAAAQNIDLIITDMKMPGMDGLCVLQHAKKLWPATEVILATGYSMMDMALESKRHGAFDCINKPYDMNELLHVVGKALEAKRAKTGPTIS